MHVREGMRQRVLVLLCPSLPDQSSATRTHMSDRQLLCGNRRGRVLRLICTSTITQNLLQTLRKRWRTCYSNFQAPLQRMDAHGRGLELRHQDHQAPIQGLDANRRGTKVRHQGSNAIECAPQSVTRNMNIIPQRRERQASRPVDECRRERQHGRTSLPSSAFQCRHDGGLLFGKALQLRLQRCSALNVKGMLQRPSMGCPAARMHYASRLRKRSRHRCFGPGPHLARRRNAVRSEEPHLIATSAMLPQRPRFPVFGGRSVEHRKITFAGTTRFVRRARRNGMARRRRGVQSPARRGSGRRCKHCSRLIARCANNVRSRR